MISEKFANVKVIFIMIKKNPSSKIYSSIMDSFMRNFVTVDKRK